MRGDIYLENRFTDEYIVLNVLSDELIVHRKILDVFQSSPINRRLFDNNAVKDLVNSIVGRWHKQHPCSITFFDTVPYDYTNLDKSFIKAMLSISMLNYGITFTEDKEDCLKKMEEWFKHMNTEKSKRKQHEDTIKLSCSMDDIWKTHYKLTGLRNGAETKHLCTELCVEFTKNNKKDLGPKIPFNIDMMSDEFVEFFKYIQVFPAQMVDDEEEMLFSQLRLYFNNTFEQKYELPDGVAIDTYSSYDLSHPYFQKEVYFKKDLLLKHSSDVDHRFSLLQIKGEKITLQNIIQLISEFGNTGRNVMIDKEELNVEVEDYGDGDFNMYESVSVEAKKQYDIFDKEGLSKETLNVHIWFVAM